MDSRQIGQTALSIEERSSGSKSSTRSSHDDNQHDSFFVNSLRITIVVAAYWCVCVFADIYCILFKINNYCLIFIYLNRIVSISMVFMNKYLLSSPDLKVKNPCQYFFKFFAFNYVIFLLYFISSMLHYSLLGFNV